MGESMVNPQDMVDLVEAEVAEPSDGQPQVIGSPERRKADLARIAWETKMHNENSTRFQSLEDRMTSMESGIGDVLAILHGARTGIKFGMAISSFAKWLLPILGVAGIIWGYLHGGNVSPPK